MLPRCLCLPFSLFAAVQIGAQEPQEPQVPLLDAALQAWAAHAQHVQPTVTKETGDTGGKIFGETPDAAHSRHYYIAAEVAAWDFAPSHLEGMCGRPIPAALAQSHTAMKLRYVQYTDATFTTRVLPTGRLGILGPTLRGVVGEDLVVTFLNRAEFPISMHPHGVKYDRDSEGATGVPEPGKGAAVGPGATFTYVWRLDEASGPLPTEPSSKGWLYHSHVVGDEDANLGLVGGIIVTDPARARADGTPKDVDREMAALFMIFNESGMTEADEEAAESAGTGDGDEVLAMAKSAGEALAEHEAGSRYAINGYIHGNLPGLEANEGERVRWYLFGLGDENDNHTAHWHGARVIEEGRRRTDVVELLPASMKVADQVADNAGTWLFHCHVAEHMAGGMFANLAMLPKGGRGASGPAFLGVPGEAKSMRVDAVTMGKDGAVRISGETTVPDAFALGSRGVRVDIAGKSVVFPGLVGSQATVDGVGFKALNVDRYGYVYGGVLRWEVTLPSGTAKVDERGRPFALTMILGDSRHAAQLAW